MEGFIKGETERGVVRIKRWSGMLQLSKDRATIDVVKEGVVIISQIREAPVISEDILNPAATTFAFRSNANDVTGRSWCGLRWRYCR